MSRLLRKCDVCSQTPPTTFLPFLLSFSLSWKHQIHRLCSIDKFIAFLCRGILQSGELVVEYEFDLSQRRLFRAVFCHMRSAKYEQFHYQYTQQENPSVPSPVSFCVQHKERCPTATAKKTVFLVLFLFVHRFVFDVSVDIQLEADLPT